MAELLRAFPSLRFRGTHFLSFPPLTTSIQTRLSRKTRPRYSSVDGSPVIHSDSDSTRHVLDFEYVEDVERLDYYRPGGYHPIMIGDCLGERYRVVHKLGHGTYSTTWLARDEKRNNRLVAVKVGIADSSSRETDVLSVLAGAQPISASHLHRTLIPCIHDKFDVQGPNGVHPCYATAPARSSLSGTKEGSYTKLFQVEVARALAAQLALATATVHAQGYVHGDLHIGNVLLRLPEEFASLSDEQLYKRYGAPELEPVRRLRGGPLPPGVPSHVVQSVWLGKPSEDIRLCEATIFLADFGEAFSPLQESRYESHTPNSIRPPETRFEPSKPLSFSSDIWTLACSIWAILGQRSLLDYFLATPDELTCEQVDINGVLPPEWWIKWEARSRWFDEAGETLTKRPRESLEERFEDSMQTPRRDKGMPLFDQEEKDALLSMFRSMLLFRPEARLTASQVLETKWMRKWALPEYEKIRT